MTTTKNQRSLNALTNLIQAGTLSIPEIRQMELVRNGPIKLPRLDNRLPSMFQNRLKDHTPALEIRNADTDEADVLLYDEIGFWGTTAKTFVEGLSTIKSKTINLRINSPGGDVFDGIAMYNALKRHNAKKVVHVEGLAASAASIVAMAGDKVLMSRGSFMMIHNAWALGIGNAETMRDLADLLDSIDDSIADIYSDRSGRTVKTWRNFMNAETWFDHDEAVAEKLADAVEDAGSAPANKFDLSIFNNVPESLRGKTKPQPPTNKRDLENLLRDAAGMSRRQAKQIAANAFADGDPERDARVTTGLRQTLKLLSKGKS